MSFQRILCRFRKEGDARFLSHHDLMRLFERGLRRAGLPLRMSHGFNPHPKLGILVALPLGLEADEEPLEVHFGTPVDPGDALGQLNRQLPPGIQAHSATPLEPGMRVRAESAAYEAVLPSHVAVAAAAPVESFLARDAAVVERSTPKGRRAIDVRPAVQALRLDGPRLIFRLGVGERGTPRAREVLAALLGPDQGSAPEIRVRRTALNLTISPRAAARNPAARGTVKGRPNATQDAH